MATMIEHMGGRSDGRTVTLKKDALGRYGGALGFSLPDIGGDIAKWKAELTKYAAQVDSLKSQYDAAMAEVNRLRALGAGVFSDPASAIESIAFASDYTPTVDMPEPLRPSPPGAGNAVLRALKPMVTFKIKGLDPIVMAPYGRPDPGSKWVQIALFGGAAAGLSMLAISRSLILSGTTAAVVGLLINGVKK